MALCQCLLLLLCHQRLTGLRTGGSYGYVYYCAKQTTPLEVIVYSYRLELLC
jgi:hypothetical protein